MAAIGAASKKGSATLDSDDSIATKKLTGRRIIEAEAIGRMAGAEENLPGGMGGEAIDFIEPDIDEFHLFCVERWEEIKVMKGTWEDLAGKLRKLREHAVLLNRERELENGGRGRDRSVAEAAHSLDARSVIRMKVSKDNKINIRERAM